MLIKHLFKGAVVAAIICSSSAVMAQEQTPPPPMDPQQQEMQANLPPEIKAQKQIEWMREHLALTDDQVKVLIPIMMDAAQEQSQARQALPPGKQRTHDQKEIKKVKKDEIKTVLTPEQYQKYQTHLVEMKKMNLEHKEMQHSH